MMFFLRLLPQNNSESYSALLCINQPTIDLSRGLHTFLVIRVHELLPYVQRDHKETRLLPIYHLERDRLPQVLNNRHATLVLYFEHLSA